MKIQNKGFATWQRLALILLTGVLCQFLQGCGQKLIVHRVEIPSVLTEQVLIPSTEPTNNGEMLELYLDTRKALQLCNSNLAAIEELGREDQKASE